ncbi:ParB N-terminal domain-containing protein [Leucobacter chromiiresistens]|uniref:ParB-like nuclease domain-containing protein n=1 Tax=Leucobacter chromiiresistens TaxID=1079994 RepID=A0A1H0ZYP1_9MICO|nr:ParB N-terminal domain-containing protein [Leucobacter chromiiresistens]SDQ32528.1 ParB-like nuclease domain-containing protein [Leucobacter chromiiresistens]
MSTAILPDNVTIRPAELDIASIIVRERQRGVDAAHVTLLRNSIRDTGKQIVPIAVSERADGKLVLIDGAHRLEAAKQDGRTTIRAEVYTNLAEDQESVLEFVTNRARKDLSPAEILEAWETFDLPLYQLQAKERQLSGLRQGQAIPVIPAGNNGEVQPSVSVREVAIEKTGHEPEYLAKVAAVRNLAQAEDVPDEVREVAQRGYEKLKTSMAKVDPIFKAVQKTHDAVLRQSEDPEMVKKRAAEQRLDEVVRSTTLLQEKLESSDFRDVLVLAGRMGEWHRESLRAVRVALVNALSSVVVVECTVDGEVSQSLQRIGVEVTHLFSSQTLRQLGLEDRRG